jgi:phosphoribosylanthranilate isomerase
MKPDYIGFVFAKSKRKISDDKAFLLKNALDQGIKTVGVFVNHDFNAIKKLLDRKIIDVIQLHGDENQEIIDRLKDAVNETMRE